MTRPAPSRAPRHSKENRQRRALSNVGGPTQAHGEPQYCALLTTAFGGELSPDEARVHIHGFHSYPARLHPTVARRLVELLAPKLGTVLDPFCGSGTVLVETVLAGRRALGVDLNPLAVELARLKTTVPTGQQFAEVREACAKVQQHALARRAARAGSTQRYPDVDVQLFEPHVLLELDGLRDGIERLPQSFARDTLWLLLSSILIKVSRQPGDTAEPGDTPRRLAPGFTTRLLGRKTNELIERWGAYASRLPNLVFPVEVHLGDARELAPIKPESVDLVVTSPPYLGNYDYLAQHQTRLRWLGLDAEGFEKDEIGARRQQTSVGADRAYQQFCSDLLAVFAALQTKLRPGAKAAVVIADSVIGKEPVWAEPIVQGAAKQAGLKWLATASQLRPHFHGPSSQVFERRPRKEHAILLERPAQAQAPSGPTTQRPPLR